MKKLEKWIKSAKFAEKNKTMEDSRRYPIGQQNFKELREVWCVYVDNTPYLAKTVSTFPQSPGIWTLRR